MMIKKLRFILLIGFFATLTKTGLAQGCSDAGFCTVNGLKPNSANESGSRKNQFKAGTSFGAADYETSVWGTYLEYNRFLTKKTDLGVKLTTMSQSGNEVSSFGLADIYLNANFKLNNKLKATLGAKIPMSDGNQKENYLSLPMDYQPSLGTFDLIVGLGYSIQKLQLNAALQHPLSQNNNQFVAEAYPTTSALSKFQTTNNYQRKGDVLLRASYPFDISKKIKLTLSLLPIYHLGNDKFTNIAGNEQEISGSKGMTLNGNVYLDYELNQKSALQLSVGAPFFTRDARPDGLTRSFLANLEYRIRF